jgi:hypothetical protein
LLTDSAPSAVRPSGSEDGPAEVQRMAVRIVTCGADHSLRAEAEEFVRDRFHRTHGARIATFMPTMLVLTDASGSLSGVAGCRRAASETLFLERYLPKPIEESLAASTGSRVTRAAVVEIGNFACRSPHAATTFMSMLPRHLLGIGVVWATFTATASIRRVLRHLGARCADLGAADGACVRGGADEWGRYYANDPRVMAGYLPLARRIPALWSGYHAD